MNILIAQLKIEKKECILRVGLTECAHKYATIICVGAENWEYEPSPGMGMSELIEQHIFDLPENFIVHAQENMHYRGGNYISSNHILNSKGEVLHSWVSKRTTNFLLDDMTLYYLKTNRRNVFDLCVYDIKTRTLTEKSLSGIESRAIPYLTIKNEKGYVRYSEPKSKTKDIPLSSL